MVSRPSFSVSSAQSAVHFLSDLEKQNEFWDLIQKSEVEHLKSKRPECSAETAKYVKEYKYDQY